LGEPPALGGSFLWRCGQKKGAPEVGALVGEHDYDTIRRRCVYLARDDPTIASQIRFPGESTLAADRSATRAADLDLLSTPEVLGELKGPINMSGTVLMRLPGTSPGSLEMMGS
jgi:hypothetical protein